MVDEAVDDRVAPETPRRRGAFRGVPIGVVAALVVAVGVHLLFLSTALGTDEGGFAMVARHAGEPGPYLYGPQWVDRPPLLIAVFALADRLGTYGVRIMATIVAGVALAAIARAGFLAGGRTAATWSAWTACALASSSLLVAHQLNGELIAIALVAVSVAAVLTATTRATRMGPHHRRRDVGAVAAVVVAGATASAAILVKQNFVGAVVFAGVHLLLCARRDLGWRWGRRLVGAWSLGALVPVLVAGVWAHRHGDVGALLYAMYGFRLDAAEVMAESSTRAPGQRLILLLLVAVVSGLLPIAVLLLRAHRRRLRRVDPISWAIGLTLLAELALLLAGGNFWGHYLIGLVPMVALGAGLATAPALPGWRLVRTAVVLGVVSMLVASPVTALSPRVERGTDDQVARWLRASARPGDTVAIPYSHAGIIEMSGLSPRYPYSWSLPVRTLDPDLDLLVATLRDPDAPTWVVRWDAPRAWGLDPHHRVTLVLLERYVPVASVCDKAIWLLRDAERRLAAAPPLDSCARSLAAPPVPARDGVGRGSAG